MIAVSYNDIYLWAYKCPNCGKQGYHSSEWVYKRYVNGKMSYFCTWACLNQWDKKHPTKFCNYAMGKRTKKGKND